MKNFLKNFAVGLVTVAVVMAIVAGMVFVATSYPIVPKTMGIGVVIFLLIWLTASIGKSVSEASKEDDK